MVLVQPLALSGLEVGCCLGQGRVLLTHAWAWKARLGAELHHCLLMGAEHQGPLSVPKC